VSPNFRRLRNIRQEDRKETQMFVKMLLAVLCLCLGSLARGEGAVTVGVSLPRLQATGAQSAEELQATLITQLKAKSLNAVALSETAESAMGAEARAKHCDYVVLMRMQHKLNTGGGLMSKMSMLTHLSARDMGSPDGQYALKPGDMVALDYRITAIASADPLKSDSLSTKVPSSGQDYLVPLFSQVSDAVVSVSQGSRQADTPAPAEAAPGRSGFGGLFARKNITPAHTSDDAKAASIDCAKLSHVPNAMMSQESCEKMKANQQAYSQAASDPTASREGDESMSCTQIMAEMKQQQISAPDQAKVARAQVALNTATNQIQKETKEAIKQQAEDQALVNAATAADTATELATAGLVRGRSLQAVEKTIDERQRAKNARLERENAPISQGLNASMAEMGGDMAAQMQNNPRLARLMQMAQNKRCKGGG
jgi:hypothetical protein